jgi:hypothetical protein
MLQQASIKSNLYAQIKQSLNGKLYAFRRVKSKSESICTTTKNTFGMWKNGNDKLDMSENFHKMAHHIRNQ